VDITAPVRAVVGIFGTHLAAPEIMQMLGRCRHTRETHAYVPCVEGQAEEDWQALYRRHEARALPSTAGLWQARRSRSM
jgi:hypothetical protein